MHNCKSSPKAASHACAARAAPGPHRPPGAREALRTRGGTRRGAREAAGDVAHLAEAVETRRGTVAAIKKTGVDMYGDKKAIDAVKDLQAATPRYLRRDGEADVYTLDLQIKFPSPWVEIGTLSQ